MIDRFEVDEVGSGHISRASWVLSQGIMLGSAMILPAIHHDSIFYWYLISCLFWLSSFTYYFLNWSVVARHLFLALATMTAPVIVILPYSGVSVSSLLGRVPLLIALMTLFIDEYSRRISLYSRHRQRTLEPRIVNIDEYFEPAEHLALSISGDRNVLLAHMNGGEREGYEASSQGSSEISLTIESGRLPSSCDTMTRGFWQDDLAQGRSFHQEDS